MNHFSEVSEVGDINNDGFINILVSSPWIDGRTGEIYVIFGSDIWDYVSETPTTLGLNNG